MNFVLDNLRIRTIDGTANHPFNLGAANTVMLRLYNNAYEDGVSIPRGGLFDSSSLPNPRRISNTIVDQPEAIANSLGASDWLWQWGQFIDHDLDLNEANDEFPQESGDEMPIIVPNGDPTFPDGTTLPFIRVPAAAETGTDSDNPRETINQITSFIDASSVYGSEEERATFLRSFDRGQLKTTIADNGEVLLPLNLTGDNALPNATGGQLGEFQFLAGDARANEQIGLTAVHTLFVREHNRVATDIYNRLDAGESALIQQFQTFLASNFLSNLSDSSQETDLETLRDEFIYQSARKVIGAQIQKITYEEFLPLLIGKRTLERYRGYNPLVDPRISTEFANAAFRLGHTLLSAQIRVFGRNGLEEIALEEAFFDPAYLQKNGVDSTLQGLSLQTAQEIDNYIVDGVRNLLFPAGTGGLDLASINIARGRETGLPGYVEVHNELFPNESITSFDDLPFREGLAGENGLFAAAYNDINEIDLWLGGISESPAKHGGLLGPTFTEIVADQFRRLRDGDRFFYLNDLENLEVLSPGFKKLTLSQVIQNNSRTPFLVPDKVFETPFENSIIGDATDDTLIGTRQDDFINGKAGDDVITGNSGDDIIEGGKNNDKIEGESGNDILSGEAGQDYLEGSQGKDILLGGKSSDTLKGGSGADILIGGSGDDILNGGSSSDSLNGVGEDLGIHDFDVLEGGSGRNEFVLGENNRVFYLGKGMATILDFNERRDTVKLTGSIDQYELAKEGENTILYYTNGDIADAIASFQDRLIPNFDRGFSFA